MFQENRHGAQLNLFNDIYQLSYDAFLISQLKRMDLIENTL